MVTRLKSPPSAIANCSINMDIQGLEAKIDALIALNAKLSNENRVLREQRTQLQAEKVALMEKTTLARQKIEAMIDRLKTLEAQQS